MPKKERLAIAQQWLSQLGLAGHENDYPHALSGGMRQRVSIARAFATNADILLCDEPFSALDEMTAHRLRQEFVNLVRENGKTAVFITHSINEALDIGNRVVVLHRPARIARGHARGARHGRSAAAGPAHEDHGHPGPADGRHNRRVALLSSSRHPVQERARLAEALGRPNHAL